MGYNGLGLQRWMYKQKARRPYSKDRKPSGDVADYHHDNGYIEKILTSKGKKRTITKNDSERAALRLDKKLRVLKHFRIIKHVLISVLVLLGLILIVHSYLESKKPKDRNLQAKNTMATIYCDKANVYFEKGKFHLAKSQYLKAIAIMPNSFRAYHGLALSYGNLCSDSDVHCVNSLKVIDKIREKFPDEDFSDLEDLESRIKKKFEINSL